jgi:hypothetical protein
MADRNVALWSKQCRLSSHRYIQSISCRQAEGRFFLPCTVAVNQPKSLSLLTVRLCCRMSCRDGGPSRTRSAGCSEGGDAASALVFCFPMGRPVCSPAALAPDCAWRRALRSRYPVTDVAVASTQPLHTKPPTTAHGIRTSNTGHTHHTHHTRPCDSPIIRSTLPRQHQQSPSRT